jgi:hypothetical protein
MKTFIHGKEYGMEHVIWDSEPSDELREEEREMFLEESPETDEGDLDEIVDDERLEGLTPSERYDAVQRLKVRNHMENTIRDFVNMAMIDGQKVSLRHSPKRLIEDHDYYVNNRPRSYYMKNMYRFKIPKESQFNKLRNVLPSEFEWIKTRTRLADESIMQHHCVWSYGEYIHKDQSTIYSYVDSEGKYGDAGLRYTIEFKRRESGFYIAQMQKKYDRGGSESLRDEINKLLKTA